MVSNNYIGPSRMIDDVAIALQILAKALSIEHTECKTHSVISVTPHDEEAAFEATAIYLVSAISQNIEANLQLREALFDESRLARELAADIVSVIGDESADGEFKVMVRDPWMWEAISHMLIHLSRVTPAYHPTGQVLAKTSIKHDVHDHGLDAIAIYRGTSVGITAGECKAYFDDPSRGVSDASNKLGEVDANKRDIEIR